MGRSLIGIYALAVCFCSLMCLMIALGIGGYSVVRIAAPEFTLAENPGTYTDEQFLQWYPQKKDLPAAERAQARKELGAAALHYERRGAQRMLVWVLIIAAIDGVVYALHWRLARQDVPNAKGQVPGKE